MFRALKLATVGVCATAALMYAHPAQGEPDLKRWYFAEGSTNAGFGFEEEILVGNPTGTAAQLTLRFLPSDGSAPIEHVVTVEPYSRAGLLTRAFVGSRDTALEVISTADVVVERSMYWGDGLFNFGTGYHNGRITDLRAGHNVMGANAPATSWSFAEGAAGGPPMFQTYVLVSNPSKTDSAQVKVRYLTSASEEVIDAGSGLLGPGQRATYLANAALEATLGARNQFDFAIEVESENAVPIVAERAMYWGPNMRGGHAALGVQPQSVWYFAEGVQSGAPLNFDTYILLYNPSTTEPIDVEVDFFGKSGIAKSVTRTLKPQQRDNVFAGEYPDELSGDNQAFSVRALNTQGTRFVAERAVYWRGLREGTASAGSAAAARKWGFAEGQEGGFQQFRNPAQADPKLFSTYYLILNNTDAPVTVRGVFYVEPGPGVAPGTGVETTTLVPARSRETISPSLLPGLHNRKFAAFFEATDEVIIERAMYWGDGIVGGHGSPGAVLPDSLPTLISPLAAPPPPTIASVAPTSGSPAGGTRVTITGTNFGLTDSGLGATKVRFGANEATNVVVLDANTITAVAPAGPTGDANVTVTSRSVELGLPGAFRYFDPWEATGAPVNTFRPNGGYNCTGGGRACEIMTSYLGVVATVAARQPFDLLNSCREFGGNHKFMEDVVAELRIRTGTNRWGLNIKRGNEGLSEDIVAYYYGPEGSRMNNSTLVFIIDIVAGHCGSNPGANWQDQTQATYDGRTIGRWTLGSMCSNPRYRNAQRSTGEWLFPECR